MQKKIIALAIAAAFSAPAFADTTVYGVVDAAVANISASGLKSDMMVHSGGLASSRVGVKSSEDLSSGMKASVVLEYALDTQTAGGIGDARQEMLALSGGFGTVAAGYLQTTGFDFSRFDPTGGSLVSPLGNITKGGGFLIGNVAALKRAPRALAYISPDMSGLTVALNYSTEAGGGTGMLGKPDTSEAAKATAYLVSFNYTAGPLAVALVNANMTNASTDAVAAVAQDLPNFKMGSAAVPASVGTKTSETALGASYDLGAAKLSATYQTSKVDVADNSNTVMSVGAVIPAGPGAVVLSYAKGNMKGKVTAAMEAAGTTDVDTTGMTAAWTQGLSKTATFYAAYSTMTQGENTNAYSVANNAIGGSSGLKGSSMIAAGLSKKF